MELDSFQKTILTIAIFILLFFLLFIGIMLAYGNKNTKWPPISAACPDYWDIDSSGNCVNVRNLGTCPAPSGQQNLTMNFKQSPYIGTMGNCSKYQWANGCNVSWDGVNYGVNNPCQTTATTSTISGSLDKCIASVFQNASAE